MHRVYVSSGLVLGKRGAGEANIVLAVLTSELGLVRVSARSARKEASKLRYGLEPLTTARFSFVRGRHDWKLTGVEQVSREFLSQSSMRRQQSGKIARLLLRLLPGEDPMSDLFETTVLGFQCMARIENDTDAEAVEWVLVLRILFCLGYLATTPELELFLTSDLMSPEVSGRARTSRQLLIRTINESLYATGL